jgi:3-oxoadipate enol-lactonase
VGLSMGGLIGQELAIRHPDKVSALVLANTTITHTAAGREAIGQRIAAVESHGIGAVSTSTMQRLFSDSFRQGKAATVARHQRLMEATDPEGYIACAAAVCEADTTGRLGQIRVPTLVIGASHDESLPIETTQELARAIPKAQWAVLQGCAHLSAIEQPDAFAELVGEFVASL